MRRALILALALAPVVAADACSGQGATGSAAGGAPTTGTGGALTTASAGGAPTTAGGTGGAMACDGGGGATVCSAGDPLSQSSLPREPASAVPAATLAAAVAANNAFTVDLYEQLLSDPTTAAGNVIASPLSASLALTMTYAGARALTATQMASVLQIGTTPSIFDGQNALSQALDGRAAEAFAASHFQDACPSDYRLEVVNAVWGEKSYPWEPSFLDVLAQDYGTGIYLADFYAQYDPTRQAINAWVACETDGKIQSLLPAGSLDCFTRMVLVNAVHLRLPWQAPFSTSMTVPMNFTTGAGTTVTPDFMNQTTDYPYVDDGQAQVVALPLAGGQISVVIALPHGDLATYEAALAAGDAAVSVPTAYANVQLSLPRFTLAAATFSLRESLEAMGMLQAFGDQAVYMDGLGDADFTGLVPNPAEPDAGQPTGCYLPNLQIADVLQAATIAVQESGVEATAATAVIIGAVASETSTGPPPSVPMVVNHPFLFSIVDATGAVLFVGHVQDPS